jgi:lipopolysaccharide transport system ATP-binding protein
MPDEWALRCVGVGKMYKLFGSRVWALADALAPSWLGRPAKSRYQPFWAVRGIDLEIPKGARVGIIGRNGSGKTTLMALATGNLKPTEGRVERRGAVHALMDVGAGFHPEFTGVENARAALTYQGLRADAMKEAIQEIAEFTELGEYLYQPFKSYSLGMQARLTFATATAIDPEILVIDEVLGAGDAYFINRALERLKNLIERGSALLLVSHSLNHVTELCETAIWLDRGMIASEGSSLEVVKEYERYIRRLEDRHLRAINQRHFRGESVAEVMLGENLEGLRVTFVLPGKSQARKLRVGRVSLSWDDEVETTVHVGGAQDHDRGYSSFVVLEDGGWSEPAVEGEVRFRSLCVEDSNEEARASVVLGGEDMDGRQAQVEALVRGGAGEKFRVLLSRGSKQLTEEELELTSSDWEICRVACPGAAFVATMSRRRRSKLSVSRWPGLGSLRIESVRLEDREGCEKALFTHAEPLCLELHCLPEHSGRLPVVPVAVVYREDGALLFRCVGDQQILQVNAGQPLLFRLMIDRIQLGNGRYVISVALYADLQDSSVGESRAYDLLDRSFEFRVHGLNSLRDGSYVQDFRWEGP